jgi:hypothetical protein
MKHAQECPGFRQSLARQMRDSLLGNPVTVFTEDKEGGATVYKYRRAKSSNADWWQDLPPSLDRKELRRAIDLMEQAKPLRMKRREHRWLDTFARTAAKQGWCATFKGTESPLCVSPEEPMKRGRGKKTQRVYLTLPDAEYRRVLLQACALHETPNAFMQELVPRALDADEVAAMELRAAQERMAAAGGAGGTATTIAEPAARRATES